MKRILVLLLVLGLSLAGCGDDFVTLTIKTVVDKTPDRWGNVKQCDHYYAITGEGVSIEKTLLPENDTIKVTVPKGKGEYELRIYKRDQAEPV